MKLHQVMMDGFREVRHSLQFANESPNGGINDTIWMMDGNETVFDALDRLLSGADTELVWSKDVEIDRLRMMAQRLTQQLAAANAEIERMKALDHEGKHTLYFHNRQLSAEHAALRQALAAANGRAISWWAALMEAAGCLEQAAMSMRDEDAKRAALGAAEHARNDAHRLAALSDLPEADKEKS